MTIELKKEMSEFALAFIRRNEWGRLKPETLLFYETPDLPIAVFVKRGGDKNHIIGVAACALDMENKKSLFNITVVGARFRNKGIGTDLLKCKLNLLQELKIPYATEVASDNGASLSICLKSGLRLVEIERKERTAGKFNSFLLTSEDE